jgi:hypothetical protein
MAATLITASKGANWHSKGGQLRVSGPLWSISSNLVAPFAKGPNYLDTQSTDPLKECHVNIAGPLWTDHVATFEGLMCFRYAAAIATTVSRSRSALVS